MEWTLRQLGVIAILCAVVYFAGIPACPSSQMALAAEQQEDDKGDAGAAKDEDEVDEEGEEDENEEDDEDEEDEEEENEFLGRTLRLQFHLAPREAKDEPRWLMIATRRFSYEVNYRTEALEASHRIEGAIRLIEKDKVLIAFNTMMAWKSKADKSRGSIHSEGSSVIAIGTSAKVASLGEKTLIIKVEDVKVKAKKPEKKAAAPVKPGKDEIF